MVARQGYPADGSKALPRRLERLCSLLATEEYTYTQLAEIMRVDERTIRRVVKRAPVSARLRHLRESLRAAAYDAEPLVDKRNRVVAAASLARKLRETLEANDYEDTIAVTKQGTAIKAHDRWRVQHYLDALAAVHRMVDGDSKQSGSTTTTVNVGISMEEAAVKVAALFSRMPDVIDAESTPVAPSEGGTEGSTG